MRDPWMFALASSLMLLAGCATAPPVRQIAPTDELEFVVTNESASDVMVFLVQENRARAMGRVDRFDRHTFRLSRNSLAGPRIELRAFDEALHITPTQVMGITSQEARTAATIAGIASGPFPSELARQVDWRIGNTAAVLHITRR